MLSDRLRFRDIRNTSTFRLTILLGLVAVAGMIALLGVIYGLSAHELNARSDHVLRAEAARLSDVPAPALPGAIQAAITRSASGLNYFGLLDRGGRLIAGNLHGSGGFVVGHPREIAARPGHHGPIRMLAVRAASGETILIGRDITPLVYLRWRVGEVLVLSGALIALLIVAAGIAFSLAPLRRVGVLQRSAQEIAKGDLHARMPILGRGDELDLFAATVNGMIDEVARVVGQVKAVTDAVAHDLRTPLTGVRCLLYRASQQPGIDPALADRLGTATADLDIVLERFAALLRIAELEARSRRAAFADVALNPLISSIVDLYEPLAEERGIALVFEQGQNHSVHGDDKLLFEALGNLVDNAIKFSAEGGRVAISVAPGASETGIEIRDAGPGIPTDQHKAVLRRLYRGEGAAEIAGSGLGLSVVTAIVDLHQFILEFDDAAPGLIARIRCPHR